MRNVMILAGLLVGLGTVMAQMADRMTPTPALAAATDDATVATTSASGPRRPTRSRLTGQAAHLASQPFLLAGHVFRPVALRRSGLPGHAARVPLLEAV